MKQNFFNDFLISDGFGQYPVGFGIKKRMSKKPMQIKFILAEVFWIRSESELVN